MKMVWQESYLPDADILKYSECSSIPREDKVEYRSDAISFRVLLCIDGCGVLCFGEESLNFYRGDCFFIPADSYPINLHGTAQFLDVRG